MSVDLNKTETSVFTLLSLYILMNQAVESLFGQEDILKSDFHADNATFHDLVNDTIHEALIYQILLKACAYLDEWNDILGVRTEAKDQDTIAIVKVITKSAHKAVSSWKGLRDFRNQAIAHNHRDKKGANIYLKPRRYHLPETSGEIVFLVFCLEKMTDVINHFFPHVAETVIESKGWREVPENRKFMKKNEIKAQMAEIENSILDALKRNAVLTVIAKS